MKKSVSVMMGVTAALLTACGPEVGQTVSLQSEEELEQVLPTLRPGDVVEWGGVGLTVPPQGEGVHVEALLADGRQLGFTVQTEQGGEVRWVQPQVVRGDADRRRATALTSCEDDSYNLLGYSLKTPYQWSLNLGGAPAYLDGGLAGVENEIVQATNTITLSRNSCGLVDAVSATHDYLGRTERGTQVSSAGACGSRDGHSVTGFGSLSDSSTLLVGCTWYNTAGEVVESDLLLNVSGVRWETSVTNCTQSYLIQPVVTQQRGRTFGLGRVSNSRLTMGWTFTYCDNSASSLGLGDVRGLRALY